MSLKKLSDSDVEILIELWKNERALWDVTFPKYSNADERKAALTRISQEMDNLDTRKSTHVKFLVNIGFRVQYSYKPRSGKLLWTETTVHNNCT